jgi:hypothetical protein
MRPLPTALALAALTVAGPAPAQIAPGAAAPNFTKNELVAGPAIGPARSLSEFSGKVVVLFLLGYS